MAEITCNEHTAATPDGNHEALFSWHCCFAHAPRRGFCRVVLVAMLLRACPPTLCPRPAVTVRE